MNPISDVDPALAEARKRLSDGILRQAPTPGEHPSAVPGLVFFHRDEPTACYHAIYQPSLTIFAQGAKQVNLGGTLYRCEAGRFLISSVDVPVESRILEASATQPLLSILLQLDMAAVREILAREDLPESHPATLSSQRALALGEAPLGLLDAAMRLIDLLDTPSEIPYLGYLLQREIIYRLLRTPQGTRLRAIATSGDLSQRTARAVSWLRENFRKPVRIEELAEISHMGVSTLHHQFRALTAMSPLQFQKQLRLQNARQRMLMEGIDATSAAFEVGYESVSQFNREYSRLFGLPPMRDVKLLRQNLSPVAETA